MLSKSRTRPVASITAHHVYALREPYANTPVGANQLVGILRTLIAFGIPGGHLDRNLAIEVMPIPLVDIEHARLSPAAFRRTTETAPEHIERTASFRLGLRNWPKSTRGRVQTLGCGY